MDVLAGYASDEDGTKSSKSLGTKENHENGAGTSLEAEWETFQKMIAESSPPPGEDREGASPGRSSRSPTMNESNKKSRSPSSGSSSASEESGASEGSSSESSTESDSSGSPEREKKKRKKKRRHSSSCLEDGAKPEERLSLINTKDIAQAQIEKVETEAKEGISESSKSAERSRRRRSRSRSPRSRRSRKEHKRRGRDHRRSRSRGKRSRSRDRRRRDRGRKEGHRRRRSRSGGRRRSSSRDRRREGRRRRHRRPRPRSRSPRRRSTSRPRSRSPMSKKKRNEPLSFKEKLKQSFLEVQKQAAEGKLNIDDLDPDKKGLMSMNEKPSALPLNNEKPLTAMAMGAGNVTPQQALLQTMAAMHQKAQELTGVAVPKYYNPAAVNPLKYAEQVQKRKLLWAKKEPKNQEAPQPMSSEWKAVAYSQDGDSKAAEKFRKLMGIKNQASEEAKPGSSSTIPADKSEHTTDMAKKQEELFRNLDKEYEFARMTTHTHRGVGLGFTSHVPYFPK